MARQKKKLLFTFDYELFLGKRSGTVRRCLIEPTGKVTAALDARGAKAIFFVDTTYLAKLKEAAANYARAKEDWDSVTDQLKSLLRKGHYVFPHLHPHWLDAVYLPDINQWDLSLNSRYRFHVLSPEEKETVFDQSLLVLGEIAASAGVETVIDGYRAGGWCIQPFSDFSPYFEKFGIRYDFSVLKKFVCSSTVRHYDFSQAPAEDIYSFNADVVKQEPGPYTEFTISSVSIPPARAFMNRLLLKFYWKTGNRYYGDGNSVVIDEKKETAGHDIQPAEMISIELLSHFKLHCYYNYLEKNSYMHFISHPKMLAPFNIDSFNAFLVKAYKLYDIETDFRKMITHQ